MTDFAAASFSTYLGGFQFTVGEKSMKRLGRKGRGSTFRLDSRPPPRQRRAVTTMNLRGLLELRPLLLGLATR